MKPPHLRLVRKSPTRADRLADLADVLERCENEAIALQLEPVVPPVHLAWADVAAALTRELRLRKRRRPR